MEIRSSSPRKKMLLRLVSLIACFVTLSGCQNIEAWERAGLSNYTMRPDRDPLGSHLSEHVFFTREGTNGGTSIGSGGCGCN
jgi:hypothetical protein